MYNVYDFIESVEQVKKADLLLYAVSKKEVESKDVKRLIDSLEILKQAGKDAKGKLLLTFNEYDNDEREIYMIPEIRSFVKILWEKYKYMFYFLTALDNNRAVIFACINDFEALQNKDIGMVKLQIIYNEDINLQIIVAMQEFGNLIDDASGAKSIVQTII